MFSQISSLKVKIFEKLKHGFVDEKALITTTSLSSCHLKTLVPFCWQKKGLKLQNPTEKQIMKFKTTVNMLFNDI